MVHSPPARSKDSIHVIGEPSALAGCFLVQFGLRGFVMPNPSFDRQPYEHVRAARDASGEMDMKTIRGVGWPDRPLLRFDDGRVVFTGTAN